MWIFKSLFFAPSIPIHLKNFFQKKCWFSAFYDAISATSPNCTFFGFFYCTKIEYYIWNRLLRPYCYMYLLHSFLEKMQKFMFFMNSDATFQTYILLPSWTLFYNGPPLWDGLSSAVPKASVNQVLR